MQLLIRCGAPTRTLTLCCKPDQNVASLKVALSSLARDLGTPEDMVLLHAGHVLPDTALLSTCHLAAGSTLHASSRLRGGGGDGGSTGAESRSCYLEMYKGKTHDKVNPAEELLAKWTRCHLSGADLTPPCVIDECGTLYNKEALLQALLTKTLPAHLSYITGLKSVTELKLTPHDSAKSRDQPKEAVRGMHQPGNEVAFCCPITGLEFNGRFKFSVHRPTGTAISDKALKEVPAVVTEMLGEHKPEDWVPVNPAGEQLESLKVAQAAKMAAERAKKAKKAAAKLAAVTASNGLETERNGHSSDPGSGHAGGSGLAGTKRGSPGETGIAAGPVKGLLPAPAAAAAAGMGMTGNGGGVVKKAKGLDGAAVVGGNGSSVYASLFTSSIKNPTKETYCCRSTSARGMHLS